MSLWNSLNLSALSIGVVLTFIAIVGETVVLCSDTATFNHVCELSLNTWGITSAGYTAVKAVDGGALLVDTLKICTVGQFIFSFLGWMAFVYMQEEIGAYLTAVGHVFGWILIIAVAVYTSSVTEIIDSLFAADYSAETFLYGNAMYSTIVATCLQLVAFVSIMWKLYM